MDIDQRTNSDGKVAKQRQWMKQGTIYWRTTEWPSLIKFSAYKIKITDKNVPKVEHDGIRNDIVYVVRVF